MHTAGDGNSCIRQSCKLQPPWQCTGEQWLWGSAALFTLSGSEAGSWTGVPEGDWGIAHLVECFTILPQACFENTIFTTSLDRPLFSLYLGFAPIWLLLQVFWDVLWERGKERALKATQGNCNRLVYWICQSTCSSGKVTHDLQDLSVFLKNTPTEVI